MKRILDIMKRIYVLLLVMVLLLAACGRQTQGADTSQTPTWQEQYDLGVRYLSEGNYEEAIIAFTAAIEIDPKRTEAYVGRGNAYILSGETDENLAAAQMDYEMAIEIDETNADAYLGLADVYTRQKNNDKVLEILRMGAEKTDDDQTIVDKIAVVEVETNAKTEEIVDVTFSRYEDGFYEYAIINGVDVEGNTHWSYTTDYYESAQLYRVNPIELRGQLYYFNDDRTITTLDLQSGQIVWKCESGGSIIDESAYDFGEDGTLYYCGYLGPDFCAVGADGTLLQRIEQLDTEYCWANRVEVDNTRAIVSFEMGPDGYREDNGYQFYVDLNNWSYGIAD